MGFSNNVGNIYISLVKNQILCGKFEVLNKHAPLQHKIIRSSKVPWITNKIKGLINTRYKLKSKAIITKLGTDWLSYKIIRNQVNIALRNAKKNYYSTKIAGQKI